MSHHRCGAANRQESIEEYMKTLEVMNQVKERIDKRTDNLEERQRVGDGTSRITNRENKEESEGSGLL